MEYLIRLASENDAKAIAHVHIASWQKIYRGHIADEVLDALCVEKREKKWWHFIRQGTKVLVIESNHQIVGFACIGLSRDPETDRGRHGEIYAIYMHPAVWHQGLGKKLCAAALTELASMGFDEVILWALKENTQARQFYEALGFTFTGQSKVDTLSACVLGIIPGEQMTEATQISFNEVHYIKNLVNIR